MGLQAITGGEISFDGEPLSKTRLGKSRRMPQYVSLDATASLSPRMTVGNAVVGAFDHRRLAPKLPD